MFVAPADLQPPAPTGRRVRTLTCASLLAVALAGCGGSDDLGPADAHGSALIPFDPVAPLLADDGSAMPSEPATVPDDAAAWTRNGLYASARQAEQLEHALGMAVLPVDVRCCGSDAAESAIGIAYAYQATHALANSTPVLVRSADRRLGASVANRLLQEGYANVWLVTR